MKIDEFDNFIDADLGWRKKEISELYLLANKEETEVLLKSLILLLYSHWEGFIKRSSKLYLKYISDKNITLSHLEENFHAICMKKNIARLVEANSSISIEEEIRFIKKSLNSKNKFKIKIDMSSGIDNSVIDTQHNLSSKVHKKLYRTIGIHYKDSLSARGHYLDGLLLRNRNAIAHGDFIETDEDNDDFSISLEEIEKLKKIVLIFLDSFKEELSDYVANEYYLKSKKNDRLLYETQRETYLSNNLKNIN